MKNKVIDAYIQQGYVTKEWMELIWEDILFLHHNIAPVLSKANQDGRRIYPDQTNILRVFRYPLPQIVVLGKCPYSDGRATGLAYDNYTQVSFRSPSLRHLLDKLKFEIEYEPDPNKATLLEALAEKGWMFYNVSLTTEENEPDSHRDLWGEFTERVFAKLNTLPNITWIILGNELKRYKTRVINPSHKVICAPYPSGHNGSKFVHSKIFNI